MNKSTVFGIKIDFGKSSGTYIFDKISNRRYLDFFGMYATLPLGYNHPIFSSPAFREELLRVSSVKITNCEILADESTEFYTEFSNYAGKHKFQEFHFCCTGALGIEAAIKTAIDYKKYQQPKVISFNGNFHGINSYGGFLTSRFYPVSNRLDGFPQNFAIHVDNPVFYYENGNPVKDIDKVNKVLKNITGIFQKEGSDIVAVLVEPIQCTFGDYYYPMEFFNGLRTLADEYDVPLIFDEIQTGFGGTGKLWYFEHLDIEPDILVFGKKTQISGIMVKEKFAEIFKTPIRLEVTWDGDLVDMIRCKYIMRAYEKHRILDNVNKIGKIIVNELKSMKHIINCRGKGLLIAFDFDSSEMRDKFFKALLNAGMICNPTREKSMRFRPNLNISMEEANHALGIIKKADNSL